MGMMFMYQSDGTGYDLAGILEKAGLDLTAVAEWEPEQKKLLITAMSTWALKEYVRLREEGTEFNLADPRVTTATEAAVGATSILAAVRLETFELAMWQGLGQI
jgi:hypothetical protein